MSRRAGFTLLEICLVVVVALLFFGLAVPSVQGLFAEQRLKASFEEFDTFVHRIQARAFAERRAFVLLWDGSGITVQPDRPTAEDTETEGEHFSFGDGSFTLERPAALEKNPAVEWMFWRSGTCESAIVHYAGKAGAWTVQYDPLTVAATFLEQQVP